MRPRGGVQTYLALTAVMVLLLAFPTSGEAVFYFTKIADNNTPIPGAIGFNPFFDEFRTPVIDGSNVAFIGYSYAAEEGIYLHDGSSLGLVTDDLHNIPWPSAPGEKFSRFDDLSLDGGNVAFWARGSSGQEGIYKAIGASPVSVHRIVDKSTFVPNAGPSEQFDGAFTPSADLGTVTFHGVGNGSTVGVYKYSAGTLNRLADNSIPLVPGGSGHFDSFNNTSSSGGNVAFWGRSSKPSGCGTDVLCENHDGIYIDPFVGPIAKLVDYNTPVTGGTGNFTNFWKGPSLSGGTVAFTGHDSNSKMGVYTVPSGGGPVTLIANTNTSAPGSPIKFNDFGEVSTSGGKVAFSVPKFFNRSGIYTNFEGPLTKVLLTWDKLDGKDIDDLFFAREGFSGTTIAFRAIFKDGSDGIYLAEQAVELLSFPGGTTDPVPILMGSDQYVPIPCTLCPQNMAIGQIYRFNLALGATGLGVDASIWLDPAYAIGFDYEVDGPKFATVTPPDGIDPDNTYDLFLFDLGTGEFYDSLFDLTGGELFSFLDNGYSDGVSKFSIRGISEAANLNSDDPAFPHLFPVGFTFYNAANSMVGVTISPIVTPEPATLLLLGSGLAGLGFIRRRKQT